MPGNKYFPSGKTAIAKILLNPSSCLHRASTESEHYFTIPTDAHDYKITGMLKTIGILIVFNIPVIL